VRGHRDLRLVVSLAVVCAVVALLAPFEALRLVAAAPLCLLLPGYAITSAAFGPRLLDRGRLAVLVLGTSLMNLVLCALALNYAPGGIRDVSWAVILVAVIISTSRWAAIQRRPAGSRVQEGLRLRVSGGDAILLGGGLLAAIAALVISATPYSAGGAVGFTRLWMLPTANGNAVRIGIGNNEQHRGSYRLRVRLSGRDLLLSKLSLDPGEERELRVPFVSTGAKKPTRIAASLYRDSSPDVLYRRVTSSIGADKSGR
jgi:uncharacterized membrane protein